MMAGRSELAAWKALAAHAKTLRGVHLRELFAADAGRFERLSGRLDDLLVDWSKQRVTVAPTSKVGSCGVRSGRR